MHPPDRQRVVARRTAGQRIGPRQIDSHQPVRLAAAFRRGRQWIKLMTVAQLGEALADGVRGQRGNPQPAEWLATAGGFVQGTEDQFAFTARIRGADDPFDGVVGEDAADGFELLASLIADDQRPAVG